MWSAFGLVRNTRVFRFRSILLERISDAASQDIKNHRDFMWRYNEFGNVSYEAMATKMWRPIQSFYPYYDDLVDPNTTKEQYEAKAN